MASSKDDEKFNKMMARIMGKPWPPASSKKAKSPGLEITPSRSRNRRSKKEPTVERTVENYGLPRKTPLIKKGHIREEPIATKKRINRDLRGLPNKELDKLIKDHETKQFRIRGYDPYLDLPNKERKMRKGATDYKKGGQISKRKKGGKVMSGNDLVSSIYN